MNYYILNTKEELFSNILFPNIPRIKMSSLFYSLSLNKSIKKQWDTLNNLPLEKNDAISQLLTENQLNIVDLKTKELIESLTENIIFLPLYTDNEIYYLLNFTKTTDAIDWDNTEFEYIKGTSIPSRIKKYSFNNNKIKDIHIFKTKLGNFPISKIFITTHLKNMIEENNTKFLIFEKI